MAWTTSACLRVRPSSTDLAAVALKQARYVSTAMRRAATRTRPVLFLSLSAISLGIAAPLLPTSLLTAALLVVGIAFAVVGAGANLAGAISANRPAHKTPAPRRRTANPSPISAAVSGRRHMLPPQLVRAQNPIIVPTNHDWAELMARINHELRTPLNAVIGFSEVMALEMFGPIGSERYQDYVRHIRESAGDLLKSAEDTLALTALLTSPHASEPSNATAFDTAVADAWSCLERKAAARDIQLDLTIPEDVEVMSDPRALRQILVNMLSEGIARTAPGAQMSLLAVADGELLEIVLTVNGTHRADAPRSGTLAISLARTLLEMQGTSLLEIESADGTWSAVTVLDRAAQQDFFAESAAMTSRHNRPAMAV